MVSVLRSVSTRSLEFQNAWVAVLVGVYLLAPGETFGTAIGYRAFALLAPEAVWGAVFLVIGSAQLLAVLRDHVVGRRLAAGLTAVLFGAYVAGFLVSNPLSAAIPFVAPLVAGQVWAFYRARVVV
jgi:hypothetical protein